MLSATHTVCVQEQQAFFHADWVELPVWDRLSLTPGSSGDMVHDRWEAMVASGDTVGM